MNKLENKNVNSYGITLVALVVTIVVLLILAGITITYVVGDNSVFKQAQEAKLKTEIAQWKERLETAKAPIIIEGLGKFDPDKYFDYIEKQEIINDKTKDVIDNGDGTYDVTTKPGYIFEVALIPSLESRTDAEITYIGQAGKIAPIIKKLEVSATSNSITGKAVVSRLGNGTIEYYYKLKTAGDDTYIQITNIESETGATQSVGITAGEEYVIKVVAKNGAGETTKTAEITATKIFVESIELNKVAENIKVGKTVTLIATVKPDNATNKNVRWESKSPEIATVSENGVVTGVKEGTATIEAFSTDGSNQSVTCEITVTLPTVADVAGQIQTTTKTVEDENKNKVVIPGGFKVVPNGGTDKASKVDYTYNGDGKPCVQDGIVIEDGEGNQFVWIPVGKIKNKDGTTTTITLGRYIFDATNGTPTLVQNADNYAQTVNIRLNGYDFQELTANSTNTSAKNLGDFVTKTKAKGGYYLGRYEVSGNIKIQANQDARGGTKQPDAAGVAQEMYNNNYVESDLVNSYSWDTTIVFIQEYSGNTNYANRSSVNTEETKTGNAGDKVCNIHDIASNKGEWTTEHSTYPEQGQAGPCVSRGGDCFYRSVNATSRRFMGSEHFPTAAIGFRILLYLK